MKTFSLTILGTSAAVPYKNRYLAGQVLNVHEQFFLIDCGEATQFRLSEFKIKRHKIDHIFISHLHGDHFFGIFGVLTSLAMNGRTTPLHIYSPSGLKDIVQIIFEKSYYVSPFPIHFQELDTNKSTLIFENEILTVHSFPLLHRIPTVGYVFKEKSQPLNIIQKKIEAYKIPLSEIKKIKAGANFILLDGKVLPNAELTLPAFKTRSYAYCSDTKYDEQIIPFIRHVDLLYHESTFANDMGEHAALVGHSTTIEAATIAKKANAGKLILGHYSSRYTDLDILLVEAKTIFPETVLGVDGETHTVLQSRE